jgi:hypothetical protein
MRNLFKKKPLPPLISALNRIDEISDIVLEHKRNKSYSPTATDIALFKRIEKRLWEVQSTTSYVERCIQQRVDGEPEGATKWHSNDTMDYHYPS